MNQRKEFLFNAIRTNNFRQLCEAYGISAKTGYKWRERFYQYGFEGMSEHSRRPLSQARELGEAVICEIVRRKGAHPLCETTAPLSSRYLVAMSCRLGQMAVHLILNCRPDQMSIPLGVGGRRGQVLVVVGCDPPRCQSSS